MPAMDLKRLVAEMASQHGIRMDVNDPAISIVLLNRLMLERAAEENAGLRCACRLMPCTA
jgi:hypothetical protein